MGFPGGVPFDGVSPLGASPLQAWVRVPGSLILYPAFLLLLCFVVCFVFCFAVFTAAPGCSRFSPPEPRCCQGWGRSTVVCSGGGGHPSQVSQDPRRRGSPRGAPRFGYGSMGRWSPRTQGDGDHREVPQGATTFSPWRRIQLGFFASSPSASFHHFAPRPIAHVQNIPKKLMGPLVSSQRALCVQHACLYRTGPDRTSCSGTSSPVDYLQYTLKSYS